VVDGFRGDHNVEIGVAWRAGSTFWSQYDHNVEPRPPIAPCSTFWSPRQLAPASLPPYDTATATRHGGA
jgi:hypothetical protein